MLVHASSVLAFCVDLTSRCCIVGNPWAYGAISFFHV